MGLATPFLDTTHGASALDRVDRSLLAAVQTDDPFLSEVASHLIAAGGKRMRPLFSAMCASVPTPDSPPSTEAIDGGVSVELVQVGSLYHDDVMDEAQVRRSVDSVNARWGNLIAILAGDFLLARASEIAASLGTEVAGLLANTISRLCQGQVLELADTFNPDRTIARYLTSIEGKTASLFSTACRIGGIVSGQPRDQIDALTTYGLSFGMAFQIIDDVIDIVATSEHAGKPTGHDALEGVYTLPVLYALEGDTGGSLRALLGGDITSTEATDVIDRVRSSDGVPRALALAGHHVDEAIAALDLLPGNAITAALADTARATLDQVPSTVAA